MTPAVKKRLGELLVESGIIDETQLAAALGHQRQWGIRLGQAVVDMKLASEADIVRVLAKRFGFEVARLDQVEAYAHAQAVTLVPRDFAVRYNVFPLGADTSTLSVAMSDPTNLAVVDELRFRTGRRVKVGIGGDHEIAAAVTAAYPSEDGGVEAIALDVDEGSGPGDAGATVMDGFGGGSADDFDSFFGAESQGARSPAAAAGELGGAPNPFLPAAGGAFAQGPAAAPVTLGPAPSAQSPGSAPAARPAAAQAPAARPAAAQAPVAAPAPPAAAPRPAPAAPASRTPTVPVVRAVSPATTPQRPAAAPRPAAPAGPAPGAPARPAAPSPVLPRPGSRPAAAAPANGGTPPAAVAPAPAAARPAAAASAVPRAVELELEFPSADALTEARARRVEAVAPAAPVARAAPVVEPVEELTPLPDDAGQAQVRPRDAAGDQAVLDALARLAAGGHAELELLKPTQAIAVLIRLLIRKGIIEEQELLDGLKQGRS